MFNIYLSLVCALIIQLIVIDSVFSSVALKKDGNFEMNNLAINTLGLILMISTSSLTCYYFLKGVFDEIVLTFIILLISALILFWWLVYKTNVLAEYVGKVTYEYTEDEPENNENNENNETKPIMNVTGPAFSRFHNKNNRDFSFETSYPDYNKIKSSLEQGPTSLVENKPDYSMYNGYDPSHICYNCGCITKENGYTFCGKEIPGMGTIGCSSRWGCRSCKKCEEPSNTAPENNSSDYTCKDCKCLDTDAGKICGRVSRADGFVNKCSSECSKCDKCYGEKNSNNLLNSNNDSDKYITVDANSNLGKIIINNIKNSDLNDIIEN